MNRLNDNGTRAEKLQLLPCIKEKRGTVCFSQGSVLFREGRCTSTVMYFLLGVALFVFHCLIASSDYDMSSGQSALRHHFEGISTSPQLKIQNPSRSFAACSSARSNLRRGCRPPRRQHVLRMCALPSCFGPKYSRQKVLSRRRHSVRGPV